MGNASVPISRSDSHAFAFSSIQRAASRCDTKPGMCSRLPCGQTTRTYHPCADDKLRASKAGFDSCSNMIRPASNGRRWSRVATRHNADITMDRVDSSNVEPDIIRCPIRFRTSGFRHVVAPFKWRPKYTGAEDYWRGCGTRYTSLTRPAALRFKHNFPAAKHWRCIGKCRSQFCSGFAALCYLAMEPNVGLRVALCGTARSAAASRRPGDYLAKLGRPSLIDALA